VADEQTIDGFKGTLKTSFNAMMIVLDDVIEYSDELLGLTDKNKDKNDKYDMFLGAQDSVQKRESVVALTNLIGFRDGQDFADHEDLVTNGDMTNEEILEMIDFING